MSPETSPLPISNHFRDGTTGTGVEDSHAWRVLLPSISATAYGSSRSSSSHLRSSGILSPSGAPRLTRMPHMVGTIVVIQTHQKIKKGTCITHPVLQTPQSPQKFFLSVFLMLVSVSHARCQEARRRIPSPAFTERKQKASRRSGISVKVLTGDNERVTRHVFAEIGVPVTGVLTGDALTHLSEEALIGQSSRVNLFCRVNPVS